MNWFSKLLIISSLSANLFAVGEAGGIFLLIVPGAGPASMGEAYVAKADDAYATFFNPAGMAFLPGAEMSLMHVNWLPNLADDLYYEFLAGRYTVPNLGSFGGHIIFLDLGEQIRTNEEGVEIGTFRSNMWALTGSYGTLLSPNSAIGVSAKIFHQNLSKYGVAGEKGTGKSTDFAFDVGYLVKNDFLRLNFGAAITNIGPKITFKDDEQADPTPTNMRLGFNWEAYNDGYNKFNVLLDMNKLLVASYPAMDWDGDGFIGGYDEDGHASPGDKYSEDGKIEDAHTDSWWKALATSWLDDWYLGGDIDHWGRHTEPSDGIIGGYVWNDVGEDGNPNTGDDGEGDGIIHAGVYDQVNKEYSYPEISYDPENEAAIYNSSGVKEVGSEEDREWTTEFKEMVYNIGFEYWYANYFALRAGYIYDEEGKIKVPTFGAGVRLDRYGFDFGYTAGEQGHPRANTMFFSINMLF